MGGSASRELEAAQAQVRQLTVKLQQAQKIIPSSNLAAATAVAAAKAGPSAKEKELQQQLAFAQSELSKSTQQLQVMQTDMPKIKREVATAREELVVAKRAEAERGQQMTALQSELRVSKEELEQLFGRLKFAEQESAAVRKIRTEDTKALAEQQKAAAEASVRLVSEASAALVDAEGTQARTHPVFGELLHDFGHKRIYLGSPTLLWAGTLLWERQRAFRQERASLIAQAKAKSHARGWPGSIAIVETNDQPASSKEATIGMLIDGQHRLGAAHLLAQKGKLLGALQHILVEVYPPREEKDIKELFTEINRAEPVLLIDLPDENGGASDKNNATITIAAETLRERYPGMFKPSHGCRPPHLNVDVLRAEMHKAELIERNKIKSAEQLVDWIEARNLELAAKTDDEWGDGAKTKSGTALEKALAKAREQGFYLGLSWDWLDKKA